MQSARFATESRDFSPLLPLQLLVRTFLRRIPMRRRSHKFNVEALKNHLGLKRPQVRQLNRFVASIDLNTTSIQVIVYAGGGIACTATDEPIAVLSYSNGEKSKRVHGTMVAYHDDDVNDYWLTITAPNKYLEPTAPNKGHCVYQIHTLSPPRSKIIAETGKIPMPKGEPEPNERMPFDFATKGKIPCYTGKTSAGVYTRTRQHIISALSGSNTRFHRVLRGDKKYLPQLPRVHLVNQVENEVDAYAIESKMIETSTALEGIVVCNMIGATMALEDLLKQDPSLRGKVKAEYAEELLVERAAAASEAWDDPLTAEAIICNNPNNFSGHEVRLIRYLARLGVDNDEIATRFDANPKRITSLLNQTTYKRVL